MLEFLNVAFFVFHTAFTVFNLVGWIWRKTRPWQLATLLLTVASWFGLGIWYGWGYCPCTDWHWEVRAELGYYDTANNYIEFLVEKLTGLFIPTQHMESILIVGLGVLLALSVWLNWRDRRSG